MDLPLFPLNTVLFPGARLPLHIFEARYRQMIGECLEEERPFGVVLIREGPEVGGGAAPHRVGVTARIAEVERLPDGRMNIVTLGQERFRILATSEERPYLTGEVEYLPDDEAHSGAAYAEAERLQARYLRFVQQTLALRNEWTREANAPTAPGRLADHVADQLPVGMALKQQVLEEVHVPRRLTLVHGLLERVLALMEPRVQAVQVQRRTRFGAQN
jgi:uncharacterized protein